MAAVSDTVGPCTTPAEGVMRKASGSSTSASGTANPGTLMAEGRLPLPPGTCITDQRAGTAVGLDKSKLPSVSKPTETVPNSSLGEDPARKGAEICALSGRVTRCPVEKAKTSSPRSSGTAPASPLGVWVSVSLSERVGLKDRVNEAEA